MNDQGPTYASCKKELKTGMKVTLPEGEPGIFMKTRRSMCEVIRGENGEGMKTCVDLAGLIWKTFGVHIGSKDR